MAKLVSWAAGGIVIVAICVGATAVLAGHTAASHRVAARTQVAAVTFNGVDANDPAPQRMIPRPSPDPSPTPVPAAAAPARSAPVVTHVAPRPAIVTGSTQQALINRDRAAHGLGPLTWSSCLANVARSNAVRMESQGYISHTNGPSVDLSCGLGHQAGENVGWWSGGVNDAQLNTMFMNSPDHRANILGPYHYVASSWAVAPNGHAYIAVEFG